MIGTGAALRSRPSPCADLGAVAGLARRLEGRPGDGVVDDVGIDRLGLGDGVDRDADRACRARAVRAPRPDRRRPADARRRRPGLAPSAASPCSVRRAPWRRAIGSSVAASAICSSSGRSFSRTLTQRQPAAKRRRDDVGERRRACCRSVTSSSGGSGSFTCPTRPNCGLDGSACAPLRDAPGETRRAAGLDRGAHARRPSCTGSRAFETAVLSSTAAQPSSIASAASDAVPMPASSTTGTGERAQISSIRCGLQMPSPEPIGEPSGITAAAPSIGELAADHRVVGAIGQHDEALGDQRLGRRAPAPRCRDRAARGRRSPRA